MIRQIYLQIPMDQILTGWARAGGPGGRAEFCQRVRHRKESGGDSLAVIRDSISQIRDKMEMQREIDTILAARKYEFRVMSFIPFGIIAYMKLSFPEFMGALYGNLAGAGVMSACLAVYLGACYLGQKIVNIESDPACPSSDLPAVPGAPDPGRAARGRGADADPKERLRTGGQGRAPGRHGGREAGGRTP